MRNVAILVYENAEVLDFAGPFEVFAVTSELNDWEPFNVFTVSPADGPVRAVNGLTILPDYTLIDSPPADVLVIPGGAGSRQVMTDDAVLEWVRGGHESSNVTLSVCSGARILARAGLLRGLSVTTHHEVIDELRQLEPQADVVLGPRFVDTGRIVTTGGISAGVDGSFHVVSRLLGDEVALRTAEYMEYDWQPSEAREGQAARVIQEEALRGAPQRAGSQPR